MNPGDLGPPASGRDAVLPLATSLAGAAAVALVSGLPAVLPAANLLVLPGLVLLACSWVAAGYVTRGWRWLPLVWLIDVCGYGAIVVPRPASAALVGASVIAVAVLLAMAVPIGFGLGRWLRRLAPPGRRYARLAELAPGLAAGAPLVFLVGAVLYWGRPA